MVETYYGNHDLKGIFCQNLTFSEKTELGTLSHFSKF
jgi:hypothetical protein